MKVRKRPEIHSTSFHGILTCSNRMKELFEIIVRVAKTNSAVLIRGESGTGKELVARAIHSLSQRSTGPYHTINCATLSKELINSELFGHIKGAFTGATTNHKGYFEVAHKGTLFLDEIAELPLDAQARILRAIQEKLVNPVGSTKQINADVRILSATHKSLRNEVKNAHFREDLMYRIRVVPIFLPKLVERGRDIELLIWNFIDEFNQYGMRHIDSIDQQAYDALLSYKWPGNIRELRNNIEHAFAIGEGPILTLSDLPPELNGMLPSDEAEQELEPNFVTKERATLIATLNKTGGNKGEAAKLLNMSRSTLWRKMQRHQIFL